jgi:hypothetical protein
VVAKPIPVGGEAESSENSQAIGFGSWQSMQPADQAVVSMSYASYAMHGDIRMINVPLSTQTELRKDVRTEEEEVAEEEEPR